MAEERIYTVLKCIYPDDLWDVRITFDKCALVIDELCNPMPSESFGAYLVPAELQTAYPFPGRVFQKGQRGYDDSYLVICEDGNGTFVDVINGDDTTLFLTGECNSNCIMCPYTTTKRLGAKKTELPFLLGLMECIDPHTEYLCITGGEPTLSKHDFLRVLEAIKNRFDEAIVHILTNGRTFSYSGFYEEYKKVRPYNTLLGIPLHAGNAALHDTISDCSGSFDQTVAGLDLLYSRHEFIELRIVASALNAEELPELANFIGNRYPAVDHVSIMGLEMMGNAMLHRERVWIPFDKLMPWVLKATDILLSKGVSVQLFNFPLCYIPERYEALYRKSITPSKVEYMEDCEKCTRKNECGGFFRSTKVMSGIVVYPYL